MEKGIIRLSEVKDGEVKFLWEPYIHADNLSIIRADSGTGKTYLSCGIMAAVSSEEQPFNMPGNLLGHGNCIFFGFEDDDFVIKNRVLSAGGDLDKVFIYQGDFQLSHTQKLRDLIREHSAKLVIFDPIQSFLGAKVNMNSSNETRPLMDGIRAVAREEGCGIVLIEHLTKAEKTQKLLYRGSGSQDILNASRSALFVGYHPLLENTRVIFPIKSNAKYGQPVMYKIDNYGVFTWEGVTNISIEECQAATGIRSSTDGTDLVLEGLQKLMDAYNGMWKGSASALFIELSKLLGKTAFTPEGIGRRLANLGFLLKSQNIRCEKKRVASGIEYTIFRSKY